ncbi:hypothetical protein BX600DRAFT_516930 [Xylariales sp. PMI_506]|nr:hypothetical protein BX600DRAFT_516930 [Xylariales sp. PMI_506]
MNLLSAINTEGERDSPGSTRWKYSSHHEHQPIPPNYPFGSNGTDQNQSTTFLSTISRPIVEHLAEQYLNTTEKVYRLLHVPTFKAELQLYWDRRPEQVNDDGWMAQLCMILYLGYESLRSTTDMNAGHHFGASRQHSSFSTNLLNGTSAYLNRTPFLARPTVCTIRVLALIMLARQVSRFSCAQEDASWSLTGTIVRIAMNLGLHDEASYAILPPLQAEIRRSLWITVLCLDLRQSLLSGMPAMIVPQQFTCAVPANLDLDSIMPFFDGPLAEHDGDVRTTATFRIRFHQMLPLVCEIASAAHSTYCTYASAVAHDAQVQELLKHISNTRKHDAHNRATAGRFLEGIAYDKIDWVNIQLDILLRRLLLSVHRKFAYRSDAHTRYPVSYWSTIDCASALLVYQQQMLCHTSEVSQSDRWIAGFFRLDFFVAALTLSICLVNDKGGLHPDAARGRDARQTLKETLRSCRDLWAEETHLSICHEHISKFIERVVSTF